MDDRVDALYELPPGDFVRARDELARALKAEGAVRLAGDVKALRKPTVAAAALNRIAREHPDAVDRLLAAGEALATATGDALRDAGRERREAVQALVRRAPQAQRDEVAATLEAALVDEAVAADLRAGRLAREAEAPATFGFGALPEPAPDDEPDEPEVDLVPFEQEVASAEEAVRDAAAEVAEARTSLEEADARLAASHERAEAARIALRRVRS